MIADPGEATSHIERADVFAVADAPLVEVVVDTSVEDEPVRRAPPADAGALYALVGTLLGGLIALWVLLALGCGGALAIGAKSPSDGTVSGAR